MQNSCLNLLHFKIRLDSISNTNQASNKRHIIAEIKLEQILFIIDVNNIFENVYAKCNLFAIFWFYYKEK